MSAGSVLLTGGSGFIGRHVLYALGAAGLTGPLRLLRHQRPLKPPAGAGIVTADLEDPASLKDVCSGITTLVHLASYIGDDVELCEAVNARGTEALVARARAAGVARIITLSNAAVYGYAVHRGAAEREVIVAPATPVSRSRARAERAVLAAGGIVLRPLFVYGNGDRRFLPAVMGALRSLPFLIDRGRARLSVISAEELGGVVARLVGSDVRVPPGAYHVTDGHPLSFRAIAEALAKRFGLRFPRWSVPYGVGRRLMRLARGGGAGSVPWTASDAHRLFLVSHDHYYDDTALRSGLGLPTGPALPERLERYASWYAQFVATGR